MFTHNSQCRNENFYLLVGCRAGRDADLRFHCRGADHHFARRLQYPAAVGAHGDAVTRFEPVFERAAVFEAATVGDRVDDQIGTLQQLCGRRELRLGYLPGE